jgi:hypothetical protein
VGRGVKNDCKIQSLRDETITVLIESTGRRFTAATQHRQNYCDYKKTIYAYQESPHSKNTASPRSEKEERKRERAHDLYYVCQFK